MVFFLSLNILSLTISAQSSLQSHVMLVAGLPSRPLLTLHSFPVTLITGLFYSFFQNEHSPQSWMWVSDLPIGPNTGHISQRVAGTNHVPGKGNFWSGVSKCTGGGGRTGQVCFMEDQNARSHPAFKHELSNLNSKMHHVLHHKVHDCIYSF